MSCATVLGFELLCRYLKANEHTASTQFWLAYNECGGIRTHVKEQLAKEIKCQDAHMLTSLSIVEQESKQAPNEEE